MWQYPDACPVCVWQVNCRIDDTQQSTDVSAVCASKQHRFYSRIDCRGDGRAGDDSWGTYKHLSALCIGKYTFDTKLEHTCAQYSHMSHCMYSYRHMCFKTCGLSHLWLTTDRLQANWYNQFKQIHTRKLSDCKYKPYSKDLCDKNQFRCAFLVRIKFQFRCCAWCHTRFIDLCEAVCYSSWHFGVARGMVEPVSFASVRRERVSSSSINNSRQRVPGFLLLLYERYGLWNAS